MKVSVVIPVYNRERELERAVASVLNQSVQDFEILVVDDCSSVDLQAILATFSDARIMRLRLETKRNANVCRNLAIKRAQGAYVALLDSDDEWLPDHLEIRTRLVEERAVDGFFGSILVNYGKSTQEVLSRPLKRRETMINYLLSDGMAQTSSYFLKTTAAKQVHWDETLERHQDWDFVVRFAETYTIAPLPHATCIVNWAAPAKQIGHFESRRQFIERYKNQIQPQLYSDYHQRVYLRIANDPSIPVSIKHHYKREALGQADHDRR